MRRFFLTFAALFALISLGPSADTPAKRSARDALQPFNDLVGAWKGSGVPEAKADKQRGSWTETGTWEWQFQKDDAWLKLVIEKGKYWTHGELHYLADKDAFQLTLHNTDKETLRFDGKLSEHTLTLEREDTDKKETQRFVIRLLHENRYLYQYEVKAQGKGTFTRIYQVGSTKDGIPFANAGDGGPECIVSGGKGTIKVMYKGQTYYVCCGGCRDAFNENPEKFIKEQQEKEKEKQKAKEKTK